MQIITRSGVFIPQRIQFGLKNAPLKFQSMMDDILRPCRRYTFVHLDYILIYSETQQKHLERLKTVLTLLSNNGLYLNKRKCKFGKDTIELLGHTIDNNGITVNQSKVKAILSTNIKEGADILPWHGQLLCTSCPKACRNSRSIKPVNRMIEETSTYYTW